MLSAIRSAWALFFGMGLITLGNGLQSTLLTLRASLEGFSTATIGTVRTGYFVGFLAGFMSAPKIVLNEGHVHVFAALGSLASRADLVHLLFVESVTSFNRRFATGICFAGLQVLAESWLNDRATNEPRGQLLSF